MKCFMVPPERYPVLTFRVIQNFMFSLCLTIALNSNTEECHHKTDEEMALTGTWVIDEVRLAVQKEYRIPEIHDLYEYNVTRYDPETREGGMFAGYINTFLKLKAEASDYPAWVRTPAEEERYIQSFRKSEGIRLDKEELSLTLPNAVWLNCVSIQCGGISTRETIERAPKL